MRNLLLSIFGVFCGILVIIGTFNNFQLQKISEYQIHLQQVDQLTQDLNLHYNNINSWVSNPNSWDYLCENQNNKLTNDEYFWLKHVSKAKRILTNNLVEEGLNTERLNNRYLHYIDKLLKYEKEILTSLSNAGFKEKGAIGQMRKIVHKLEHQEGIDLEKVLNIRRFEKDFLLRKSLVYNLKIHQSIALWRTQPDFPASMNEYEIYFTKYSNSIQKIFSTEPNLFTEWKATFKVKQKLLQQIRIKLLNYNLIHSQNIQKFNVFIYITILLIAIVLSVYFSKKLSKSIVLFQKTIEKYIKSNYEEVQILKINVPKNEFGKLMIHFLQLSNKISNDIRLLEDRVERRTQTLKEKNDQLLLKHDEIYQGMRYAKDIQQSLMSNSKELSTFFGKIRVYFNSRDLVGGDFYWSKSVTNDGQDLRFFALADCTGHGVSGAMLSIFGMQSLDEIIGKGLYDTGEILNQLRWNVSHRLNRNNDRRYDGMDIALFSIDYLNKTLHFSGANLSVWLFGAHELIELKGQRMPIGWTDSENDSFKTVSFQLFKKDKILIFSDGISDQFGGSNDKKWGKKAIKSIIDSNFDKGLDFMFDKIMHEFELWKSSGEQTDDCTLVILEPFFSLKE